MKLKKILAVALAATTALTMVPSTALAYSVQDDKDWPEHTTAAISEAKTRAVKDATFQVRVDVDGQMVDATDNSRRAADTDLLYTYTVSEEAAGNNDGEVKLTSIAYTGDASKNENTM